MEKSPVQRSIQRIIRKNRCETRSPQTASRTIPSRAHANFETCARVPPKAAHFRAILRQMRLDRWTETPLREAKTGPIRTRVSHGKAL
jgi:hypothetical protein